MKLSYYLACSLFLLAGSGNTLAETRQRVLECSEYTTLENVPRPWEGQYFEFKFSETANGDILRETTDVDLNDLGDPSIAAQNIQVEKDSQGSGLVQWTLKSDEKSMFRHILSGPWINSALEAKFIETLHRSKFSQSGEFKRQGDIVGWINVQTTNERTKQSHKIQFVCACRWTK